MKKLFILLLLLFTTDLLASGIASNSATAPCTNNTLETYSGNSNLAADWQPNTINLTWYNENEKLTVQQSAQSCVYDGTLTIPSTPPTRTGYTFAGWKVRLPGTYTELEYIKSSGSQVIETNFVPNNNTHIRTKIYLDDFSGLFGSTLGFNDTGFECYLWSSNTLYCNYGSSGITAAVAVNNVLEIDWNKNIFNYKINNGDTIQHTFPTQTFTTAYQMRLFSLSRGTVDSGGDASYVSSIKMYYFQIYDNGTLIRDYIPARRNVDGVVGMYDTVEQLFYTNPRGTNFVAGPVVQ